MPKRLTMRNRPNSFHRTNGGIEDWEKYSYSFATMRRNGELLELGVRKPSDKELDRLIDWLIRVRAWRKFVKQKTKKGEVI